MSIRSQDDLKNFPCLYKLKDFEKTSTPVVTQQNGTKIKKLVPKTDENGNVVYKTIQIPVKSGGCACKGNQNTQYKEQKTPEMVEVLVDAPVGISPTDDNKFVICKLYGTVKRVLCENCKTYKKN